MQPDASTATQILTEAEYLVRSRGYNAFSYADIAKAIGITTASIHYHFPTKAALVRGLASRYIAGVEGRLEAIGAQSASVHERLAAYVALFRESLGAMDRMCACMMLATEIGSMPEDVRASVSDFFRATGAWVAKVLSEGRDAGEIEFSGPPLIEAAAFCSMVQGATVIARGCDDIAVFDAVAERALASLRPRASSTAGSRGRGRN